MMSEKGIDLKTAIFNQPIEKAKEMAERLLIESPNSLEALQFCGFVATKEQDYENALLFFNKALKINPLDPGIHSNLSNVYTAIKDFPLAIQHLREALRIRPMHAESYNNLGRIYYIQKLINEAIPYFEKSLRLDPNYWEAHYNIAHSLASLNQLERASSHYKEVIRIFPAHANAHYNLGLILFSLYQYEEAIHHIQLSLEYDKQNVEAYKFLGQAYVNIGQVGDAISVYEHALTLDPNSSENHHNLAILYLRNEERAKALHHFMMASSLDPNNDTARHMVMSLSDTKEAESAPQNYVAQLFDQYAEYYDEHMKLKLNYQVPGLLRSAIGRCLGSNPKATRILDIGCGTGQCGVFFRDLAIELIGIDLSTKMIEQAKMLGAYEAVIVADMFEYLSQEALEPFGLIIAGDVLVYQGELRILFQKISAVLETGGFFTFTTEYLEHGNFELKHTGRFAHSNTYIHQIANQFNFIIRISEQIIPRKNNEQPIQGRLYVLEKKPNN